jgi:hypothetical protein
MQKNEGLALARHFSAVSKKSTYEVLAACLCALFPGRSNNGKFSIAPLGAGVLNRRPVVDGGVNNC